MTTDHTEALDELLDAALEPPDWDEESFQTITRIDSDGGYSAVGGDDETDPSEPAMRWKIDGERTAAWAVRRYRRALDDITAAEAVAAEAKRAADEYVASVHARADRDVRFFEGKLREFHAEATADRKTKTFPVLGAKLSTHAGGVKAVVSDDHALVDWLEEHGDGDAIAYTDPAPKLNDIKARYGAKVSGEPGPYPAFDEATGEVLPGVELVRSESSFKIDLEVEA